MTTQLAQIIDAAWEARSEISLDTKGEIRDAVNEAMAMLDSGTARVAEKADGEWQVNQWLKKAVLLSFALNDMEIIEGGPGGTDGLGGAVWWDKVPSKFKGWGAEDFRKAALRAVPGSIVRRGAHIGRNVVLMPSFVNLGAYVGDGTMVDTWASVGSCAQVGSNCHISAGRGHWRSARTLAGQSHHHRRQLLHRRAQRGRRRRSRRRRQRHFDGRFHHAIHEDCRPRNRRDHPRLYPALFGSGSRRITAASRSGRRSGTRAFTRLCGDRENRRRRNAGEDRCE